MATANRSMLAWMLCKRSASPSGSEVRSSSRTGHERAFTTLAARSRTPKVRTSAAPATAAPPTTDINNDAGSATEPSLDQLDTIPASRSSTGSVTPRAST
jgi:hypothetical protein